MLTTASVAGPRGKRKGVASRWTEPERLAICVLGMPPFRVGVQISSTSPYSRASSARR